jgi:hypothetical protein
MTTKGGWWLVQPMLFRLTTSVCSFYDNFPSEFWGFCSGADVDVGLVRCDATWTCKWVPTFSRNVKERLKNIYLNVRFEVLTAVKMSLLFLWVVTPCGLVGRYHCFGGKYASSHGVVTQRNNIDKFCECLKLVTNRALHNCMKLCLSAKRQLVLPWFCQKTCRNIGRQRISDELSFLLKRTGPSTGWRRKQHIRLW